MPPERYEPAEFEAKWRQRWKDADLFRTREDTHRPKFYGLDFFPYPSGAGLSVGHCRNYVPTDVLCRMRYMQGYNVLHPMGFDAFGLPAENEAIKNKTHPEPMIRRYATTYRRQMELVGISYDWSRTFASSDPDFYKWTQWCFELLFKRGLAYRKLATVNWDPVDKTVLADEEIIGGRAERSGALVEKRLIPQWFFKITDYAQRLIDDLDDLDWPEGIKVQQRNWIGRSEGVEFEWKVAQGPPLAEGEGLQVVQPKRELSFRCFTTRIDTVYGATFCVLAPEHPLVEDLAKLVDEEHRVAIRAYQQQAKELTDTARQNVEREKTGVFTGAHAINPFTKHKVPIYLADYVLMGYGTGAIMAVPAHDQRDFEFAKRYKIDVRSVVRPAFDQALVVAKAQSYLDRALNNSDKQLRNRFARFIDRGVEVSALRLSFQECRRQTLPKIRQCHSYADLKQRLYRRPGGEQTLEDLIEGRLFAALESRLLLPLHFSGENGDLYNSTPAYNGLSVSEAQSKMADWLETWGIGHRKVQYKLRDWLISRQRYWGCPIPVIHSAEGEMQLVPEDCLPVTLPKVDHYEPAGDGSSPLKGIPEFVNVTDADGRLGQRETDTMGGFACSSWYFLRFCDPHNPDDPWDKLKVNYWMPVDCYVGGAEHAVMHLLYARFWTKVFYDEGLVPVKEPFARLQNQGQVLGHTPYRQPRPGEKLDVGEEGVLLSFEEASKLPEEEVMWRWARMSKSKGNVVTPDDAVGQYGADALRVYELFVAPFDADVQWSNEGMNGAVRFLSKVFKLVHDVLPTYEPEWRGHLSFAEPTVLSADVRRATHKAIKKVTEDIERFAFNTAVSALMILVNTLVEAVGKQDAEVERLALSEAIESLVLLLSPIAPHSADELWEQLGHGGFTYHVEWPMHDEKLTVDDTVTVAVQVNGKLRDTLEVATGTDSAELERLALALPKVQAHVDGKTVRKVIVVQGKLVNVVAS